MPRPLVTEPTLTPAQRLAATEQVRETPFTDDDRQAAEVLIRHLFAHDERRIDRVEYDVAYKLSAGAVGGDIVDVYHFDNGNVLLAIADISGKGAQAAIHAALVKYGLRCYASSGLTAERVLRSLDRAYVENNAFERTESFASVFLAIVDADRRSMAYSCAGHEPVFLRRPGGETRVLVPTAPLIGVFDDQHHLFTQKVVDLEPCTLIVVTTDGYTEARSPDGTFFGMDRLRASIDRYADLPVSEIVATLMDDVDRFTAGGLRDDIALCAFRIA